MTRSLFSLAAFLAFANGAPAQPIWISEPEPPADGRLQTLAVRLPRKRAEARAPQWLP